MKKRNKYMLCAMTMISMFGSMSIPNVMAEDIQPRAIVVNAYYAGDPLVLDKKSMRICVDATVINDSEFTNYYAYWSTSGGDSYWFFEEGKIETNGNSSERTSEGYGKITYMGVPQKTGTCSVTCKASDA